MSTALEQINYFRELPARAKATARDLIEDWIAQGEPVEDFDIFDAAHAEADGMDWVIYTHHALALCDAVSGSELGEAEDEVLDMSGPEGIAEAFRRGGLGGVACLTAYWIVHRAVVSALEAEVERVIEEQAEQADAEHA